MLLALANPLPETLRNEDDQLVERFRSGDVRAFDELVRRHQRSAFFVARRFVKNDADAKDLAQRAFVKAYQGLDSLRGAGAFRTWLFRIVSNLALNYLRDHARTRPTEDAGANVPVAPVGTERIDALDQRTRLRNALDELPPKQRLVLELRVFQELSFREVADAAGCTENAAKVNFHHAVKRLRAHLGETDDDGGTA